MDITLKRILSLIPKKANGQFQHGAISAFASSIGYKNGNVVSQWISGESASYQKKLHEIASVYGVSVEWLKGETDAMFPSDDFYNKDNLFRAAFYITGPLTDEQKAKMWNDAVRFAITNYMLEQERGVLDEQIGGTVPRSREKKD